MPALSYDISEQQARLVLRILIEECGAKVIDPRDADAFVKAGGNAVRMSRVPVRRRAGLRRKVPQ